MAIDAVTRGVADLVAFGKPFISNPDLVNRLRLDAPLAAPNSDTLYGGGARGYTDYPRLDSGLEKNDNEDGLSLTGSDVRHRT